MNPVVGCGGLVDISISLVSRCSTQAIDAEHRAFGCLWEKKDKEVNTIFTTFRSQVTH